MIQEDKYRFKHKYALLIEKKEYKLIPSQSTEIFINFNDSAVVKEQIIFFYRLQFIKINCSDSYSPDILTNKLINSEYNITQTQGKASPYFRIGGFIGPAFTRNLEYLKINKFIKDKSLRSYIYLINNESIIKLLENDSMVDVMNEYLSTFVKGLREI